MFSRLPESNAKRQRRLGGAAVSTVVHLVFIALAVHSTRKIAKPAPRVTPVDVIFTHDMPPAPEPSRQRSTSNSSSSAPSLSNVPRPVTPVFDLDLPGIPDPGETVEFHHRNDFDRSVGSVSRGPRDGAPNVAAGSPFPEHLVDKPVLAIPGTATPRYPTLLQSAGVEGDVRAQFVVDTLGRVERGSVRILDSSHEQFASAVRDALGRARFKAAEAAGNKVRQLVEQAFTFRITK